MANRQRISVTPAGRVSRRLPRQAASNTSAPAEGLAQRTGGRVAVWHLEQGAAGPADRKATLRRRRGAREGGQALRNPYHLRARPPSPQRGNKMNEATCESREASLRAAIRMYQIVAPPRLHVGYNWASGQGAGREAATPQFRPGEIFGRSGLRAPRSAAGAPPRRRGHRGAPAGTRCACCIPRAPPSTSFPHLAQEEQEGEVSVRIDEGEAPLSRWSQSLLTSLLVTFCFV